MIRQDGHRAEDVAGFSEALSLSTMTAKTEELKRIFLPFTRTLTSLSRTLWWESRIGARRKLGFPKIPEKAAGSSKCALLMPVVDVKGRWHPQAMCFEQLNVWFKLSFDYMMIASHSLKVPPLFVDVSKISEWRSE